MNEYVNPPFNYSLATSFNIQNIELNRRRKRSEEDIPVCWWSCWRRSIGDWRRSGREKCVPWSSICPQFRCSREGERMKCVRRALEQFGCEVISGNEPVLDAENEGEITFVDVVGTGQRWGRRVWGFHLRGFPHACEFALRNCSGRCYQFIRTATVLVFFLHFR